MKIILMFILAIGHATSDKLDRTYLPPPGSKFSGGTAEDLQTPFEFPKQYYTTTEPQPAFSEGQLNAGGIRTTQDKNLDKITPTQYGSSFTTSSVRTKTIFNLPATTTSYAFSQTTTYSPIGDTENVRNNKVAEGQYIDYTNYEPQQNKVYGNQVPGQTTFDRPTNNENYVAPIGNNAQQGRYVEDQGNTDLNKNTFRPSQNYYNQPIIYGSSEKTINNYVQSADGLPEKAMKFDQNRKPPPGFSDLSFPNRQSLNLSDVNRKFAVQPNQFGNSVKTDFIPDISAQNYYPGTSSNSSVFNKNQFPGTFSQTTPAYFDFVDGNAPIIFPNQLGNQLKNYGYNNGPNETQNYNIGSSVFSPKSSPPFSETIINEPTQFPGRISSTTPSYSSPSEITSPNFVPNQFLESLPSSPSVNSGFSNLNTPVNNKINPERPQAEGDRNAVILNYENILTPKGFSYSFDTSNGIHVDESGTAVNGVRAQGAYSYIGDDGKEYSVIYSADENGFLPRGDHLPTPPPIPEAILMVIEQAKKNKDAGIFEDGSYDDNKYGYKKYQGPVDIHQPANVKYSKNKSIYYNNHSKRPLKPDGIYQNKFIEEDTIDYIEEDVNNSYDAEKPNQNFRIPSRRPVNKVENEQDLYEKSDITVEDQRPTIGINRRPSSRFPIKKNKESNSVQIMITKEDTAPAIGDLRIPIVKQKEKGDQNPSTLDEFIPATADNKQQISQSIHENYDQNSNRNPFNSNMNKNGNIIEQGSIPDSHQINYFAPTVSKIPPRQQYHETSERKRPINTFEPAQNSYTINVTNDESTTHKETNIQQLYNPTKNTDSEVPPISDQSTGYEYKVPKNTLELTLNNQTSKYIQPSKNL